jgi:PAS domain S-box-containing protein
MLIDLMKRHLVGVTLAAGMLLAGALLAYYLHQQVKEQVLSQFNESQLLIAQQAARQIESYLDARSQEVRYLSLLASLHNIDVRTIPADVEATFTRLKAAHVKHIFILDALGRVAYSTAGGAMGSAALDSEVAAWVREPVNKGAVRLVLEKPESQATPAPGEPHAPELFFVTPLYREAAAVAPGSGGAFAGALVLSVDFEMLAERTLGLASGKNQRPLRVWAMDDDGILLLQSEHPQMVSSSIRRTSPECYQCHASFDYAENMLATRLGTLEYQLKGQDTRVAAFAPITFQDFSGIIVVNAPRDELTGFMRTVSLETLALLAVFGAVVTFAFFQQESVIAEKARHIQEKETLVERLREASEYLENLFESANAPIIVWNPQLRVTRFNRACQRLTGYTSDEVVGQELAVLFPAESREESISRIVHASDREDQEAPEIPVLRKDGTIRTLLWNSANIHKGDRTAVIATIAQGLDITERKQAEQMKADFVSFVTHQLRTPLSGIRWQLELAEQDEGLTEDTASFVADARASAERLIRLVNDLLAVTHLEGGRLAVHPQPLDLARVTADVVDDLMPLIHEKNQQINVPDAMAMPDAYGDPKLVREVVLNLLSNAMKYTPQGGSIAVSMGTSGDMVQWAVRDTGIGISREAQAHLFEKFYRAENARVMNTEGTGLGLYLARLVLERSGGRVWCESEEGHGATFTFTLPVARAPEQSIAP